MRTGRLAGGALLVTVAFIGLAFAPAAGATVDAPAATFSFPSANSQVISSSGFINSCEIGFFWSASRGDSVSQTFTSPARAKHAILDIDVVENFLSNGAEVDWSLSINGTTVDSFVVNEGFTGAIHRSVRFARINKPYNVKLFVTNEVPSGDGSISLSYADCGGPHQLVLKKR